MQVMFLFPVLRYTVRKNRLRMMFLALTVYEEAHDEGTEYFRSFTYLA